MKEIQELFESTDENGDFILNAEEYEEYKINDLRSCEFETLSHGKSSITAA
jgi:hypothetical protein